MSGFFIFGAVRTFLRGFLMEFFSLKMRASAQDQHISGAERIVKADGVEAVCQAMVRRAMGHSKGEPDFINIKIERVDESDIKFLDALKVTRVDVDSSKDGLDKAFELIGPLFSNGAAVDAPELRQRLQALMQETYGMRGAMLYDIATGARVEPDHERGVRATYMDAENSSTVISNKNHFNEAIVLATKVANAPGMVAEICISDDPDYVTGYVASREMGYVRIMKMKEPGDPNGGRIFLFDSRKASADECIDFLQKQKVLVRC